MFCIFFYSITQCCMDEIFYAYRLSEINSIFHTYTLGSRKWRGRKKNLKFGKVKLFLRNGFEFIIHLVWTFTSYKLRSIIYVASVPEFIKRQQRNKSLQILFSEAQSDYGGKSEFPRNKFASLLRLKAAKLLLYKCFTTTYFQLFSRAGKISA